MKNVVRTWFRLALQALRKTFTVTGRATRTEVVGWFVLMSLINAVLLRTAALALPDTALEWTQFAIPVVTAIPAIALLVRRLHDIALPGWWSLPVLLTGIKNFALDVVSRGAGWETRGSIEAVTRYLDWVLLPAFAFIYIIVLVAPGTTGRNRHGTNPRDDSTLPNDDVLNSDKAPVDRSTAP